MEIIGGSSGPQKCLVKTPETGGPEMFRGLLKLGARRGSTDPWGPSTPSGRFRKKKNRAKWEAQNSPFPDNIHCPCVYQNHFTDILLK